MVRSWRSTWSTTTAEPRRGSSRPTGRRFDGLAGCWVGAPILAASCSRSPTGRRWARGSSSRTSRCSSDRPPRGPTRQNCNEDFFVLESRLIGSALDEPPATFSPQFAAGVFADLAGRSRFPRFPRAPNTGRRRLRVFRAADAQAEVGREAGRRSYRLGAFSLPGRCIVVVRLAELGGGSRRPGRYRGRPVSDYVFTMYRVDKFYGPDRQVLGEHLAVVPAAARRSACSGRTARASRRCCGSWPARGDRRAATATPAPGRDGRPARAGAAARPGARTCAATSRTACARLRDLLDRFNEISAQFAEPDADFDALLARAGEGAGADRPPRRLGARRARSTARWTRCACPTGDRDVTTLSGGERRRVALCRLLLSVARPAAARRADEPPRRRVGRAGSSASSPSTRARSSRSRTTATSSTTSPAGSSSSTAAAGIPFEGNYSSLARAEAGAARGRGEAGVGAPAHARSASSSGCG